MKSNKYYLLAQEYINLQRLWNFDIEVEPGALKDLFRSLGLIVRLAKKAERFLSLPRTIMGPDIGKQSLNFVRNICPDVLGCFTNNEQRAHTWYVQAAAECKARILDKALVQLHGESQRSIKTVRNFLRCYTGNDAQSALKAIPVVELIINQYQELGDQIEDLRDPMVTKPDTLVFDSDIRLGFSPDRLFNTRRHQVVLSNNATLVNTISHWTKDYVNLKEIILQDSTNLNEERAIARKLFRTKVIGAVMPGFPL